jgi:hypothetical protein
MVFRSTDQRDLTTLFSAESSTGVFELIDSDAFDNSTGELRLRLKDDNGKTIVTETSDKFLDGDTHLLCLNKTGNNATDVNFYVDSMTSQVNTNEPATQRFNNTAYTNNRDTGFFAANVQGSIVRHQDADIAFIEFNEQPYSQQDRLDLKRRVDAIPTVPDKAVTDGLMAWYRFDGDTARDYTAFLDDDRFADTTPYDGTVNGASFVQTGGVRDVVSGANPSGAYDYDGVDDSISITGFPHQTPITISAWIVSDGNSNNSRVFRARNGPNTNVGLGVNNNNLLVQPSNRIVTTSITIPKGTPTHIGMTIPDNTTEPISAYKNGSLEQTVSFKTTYSTVDSTAFIGSANASGVFFDGITNDGRIYNRVVSASEFNQIYQNTDPDQ